MFFILCQDAPVEKEIPLKRCLAERLGGLVESSTDMPPQNGMSFVYYVCLHKVFCVTDTHV